MQIMRGSLTKIGWIDLVFLIALFLPNNAIGSLVQILLTCVLIFQNKSLFKEHIVGLSMHKLLFCTAIVVSFAYSYLNDYEFYSAVIVKLLYFVLLLISFPIIKKGGIQNGTIFIAVIAIIFTQLAYIFGIAPIINFIDAFYTSEGYFNSSEIVANETELSDILSLRFGGIYRNSNQAGRILTLLLGITLVNFSNRKFTLTFFINVSLIFLSVLLTGSRTAFFVMIILFIGYYIFFSKKKHYHLYIIGVLGILMVVTLARSGSRLLNLSDFSSGSARQGSFASKKLFLESYLKETYQTSPADLAFGTFNLDQVDYDYGMRITKFDTEVGYLIHGLGFLGLLALGALLLQIFLRANTKTRILFILLIWTLTSTVFTNFRFSFLFLFIVSLYYNEKFESNNESKMANNRLN